MRKPDLWCLCHLLLYAAAMAQNFEGGFHFYMPPDSVASSKFLPEFPPAPIGSEDFVTVTPDGHFVVQGEPIRFFGANLTAGGAFPDKTEAPAIAVRLRRMGFNLIRFHHMDNPWSRESLFEWGQDTRHLNPNTLDRLDYLLSQLKANGIYANINLHVSRTFREQDGVADADSIWHYGKGVTLFDPQLISLQKEYAAQLLTHVNPYTGLRLVEDPVMAMVEITNENSLYPMWRAGVLKPYSQGGLLMYRHNALLDSLWHGYLREKYATTENLRESWNQGVSSGTDEIIDGGFEQSPTAAEWQLEVHAPAAAVVSRDATNPYAGQYAAHVNVRSGDGTGWHVQWKQINLTLLQDSIYVVRFAARSDGDRRLAIAVQKNGSPYTVFNSFTVPVTTSLMKAMLSSFFSKSHAWSR